MIKGCATLRDTELAESSYGKVVMWIASGTARSIEWEEQARRLWSISGVKEETPRETVTELQTCHVSVRTGRGQPTMQGANLSCST